MNRYYVLFVALDELGRKAMYETTYEAESESAARQCWIDSAASEDALPVLAYVDPVTSTGIVRCRDLGPVVERRVVDSPFEPTVHVEHDGERIHCIWAEWEDSYSGDDFDVDSFGEVDLYGQAGPSLLDAWLLPLRDEVDDWLSCPRDDDAGAFHIVRKMRCLLGGKPYRPEEDH